MDVEEVKKKRRGRKVKCKDRRSCRLAGDAKLTEAGCVSVCVSSEAAPFIVHIRRSVPTPTLQGDSSCAFLMADLCMTSVSHNVQTGSQ